MRDVMKMSMSGASLGGAATPSGGGAASVTDSWGKGWGMLGNKVGLTFSHSNNSRHH